MRLRKPKCPYCGTKLNYAKTWALKRRGEYICPKCGGLSNVRLDPLLYRIGILAILIGAVFCAVGWLSGSSSILWAVPGTIVPTVLFFLISAFFVRLKKPAPPRPPAGPPVPGGYEQPPSAERGAPR